MAKRSMSSLVQTLLAVSLSPALEELFGENLLRSPCQVHVTNSELLISIRSGEETFQQGRSHM